MKRVYEGDKRREISFPVGGIGAGCIGLDGTGRLMEWEIFNRPNKCTHNGFSHFGVKAECGGRTVDARIMNADYLGPFTGGWENMGSGPERGLLCGVPHFRDSRFFGEFPLCEVEFIDETFPGRVKLAAFNPFIPNNEDDSSIPAAFYTATVTNDTSEPLTYTFELTVNNPSPRMHIHRKAETGAFCGIELADSLADKKSPAYGSIVFGVSSDANAQIQKYWYNEGRWFDNLEMFWHDLTAPGPLKERDYPDERPYMTGDLGTVAVSAEVAPGETWSRRFVIAWYYPNCEKYWYGRSAMVHDVKPGPDDGWKNWYAHLFDSAVSVADYSMREWDRLEGLTQMFHDALFSSTMPAEAIEAVSATISVLKTPTAMRLENGEFVGWEGCYRDIGSCEGSCEHVWNYAFAMPFLFPKLERSMRELDYGYNQDDDGRMAFRLMLPLGIGRSDFRACVDGQMGGIIKTYRDWKICGDDEWLKKWWPKVKKALEYAWSPANYDRWDPDKQGVITGRQHHTLDMELFGPAAWLTSFYLGALKTASEMAEAVGDPDSEEYRKMYEKGREYTDKELFNGEYYSQKVDIRDKSILEKFPAGGTITGGSTVDTYWNSEAGQIKYQIGDGCIIDQVLGQWMCELSGAGEILDRAHVDSALKAVFRHNFKEDMRSHFNPCRVFALNSDSGLVICDWPENVEKPVVPIPYGEESMHGFEYQSASHMIMHGFVDEGMRVVKGIRKRYDGEKRNPWNEMECGNNYARSMASYGLMLAFSGFKFDMGKKRLGMLPGGCGKWFWSVEGAWGTMECGENGAQLNVLYGSLDLREWVVPNASNVKNAAVNGKDTAFTANDDAIVFDTEAVINAGEKAVCAYR